MTMKQNKITTKFQAKPTCDKKEYIYFYFSNEKERGW